MKKVIVTNNRTGETIADLSDYGGGDNITGIIADDFSKVQEAITQLLKDYDEWKGSVNENHEKF